MFDEQWLLLTGGDFARGKFNAMTISWGSLGIIWGRPFVQVVVRPTRYTHEFMERFDTFTVTAFPERHRRALNLLGSKSGRDGDKIAEISFDGSGCAISQASASLMTTQLKGKTAAEAEKLYKEFHEIVTTGKEPEEISDLGAFAGVHAVPARIKCATLSWHAAHNALHGDAAAATTESHKD